jgi:hypothetical protein
MVKQISWLLAFGLALTACGNHAETNNVEEDPEANTTEVSEAWRMQRLTDTSLAITKQAFEALSNVLMLQIKSGGHAAAVRFCNEQALPMTEALAAQHGIAINRIATRYRNPANAANAYEQALLAEWEPQVRSLEKPAPRLLNAGDSLHWYAAITISNPRCLDCHGLLAEGDLFPETQAAIKALYPNDKAVNFELGDLRGLWKISYPRSFVAQLTP